MKFVNKLAVLLVGSLLSYYCAFCLDKPVAIGQIVNTNECSDSGKNKCTAVSIFIDSSVLRKGKPFWVTVKIENISDKPFRLNYLPRIVLQKKGISPADKNITGNSYESVVYFDSDSEFFNKDFLQKGEKIEFKVDITNSGWGHINQTFLFGEGLFKIVPKGEYELYSVILSSKFENNREIGGSISSNTIKVSIE